jgi:hypothetical protein
MALPNPLPAVQGTRFTLGPDAGWMDTFLIVPGTSDYVTGGYAITAIQCRLKYVTTAWVTGGNATAFPANTGWYAVTVFPIVQYGAVATGAGLTGYSQFLFKVYVASTGVEVGSGGSLAGNVWQVTVTGY